MIRFENVPSGAAQAAPATQPASLEMMLGNNPASGHRVLLVEDHPRCRQILWQQLCAYRCSVDCAESCAGALADRRAARDDTLVAQSIDHVKTAFVL